MVEGPHGPELPADEASPACVEESGLAVGEHGLAKGHGDGPETGAPVLRSEYLLVEDEI